jgi:hypothetical protein
MFCECGCGQKTKIIAKTSIAQNRIKGRYSRFVHGHHAKGINNGRWSGGRKYSYGFVMIYCPRHPSQVKNYVYEHRIVMENYISRFLDKGECIHHLNGKQDDNRIENLVLCKSNSEHFKLYHPENGKKTRFIKGEKWKQRIKRLKQISPISQNCSQQK